MIKAVFSGVLAAGFILSSAAMAQVTYETGPQPVQVYKVCNYPALFAVNNRARLVSSGGRVFTNDGVTATITRSPDIFFRSRTLVRNSFQSLSADGGC